MDVDNELSALIAELELALKQLDEKLTLVVCGGFVVHLRYGGNASKDIDSITRLSASAKQLIQNIAHRHHLAEDWLNDDVSTFFHFDKLLPSGWKERALNEAPIFDSHILKIYPLCKRDFILTKLFAVFSRGSWQFIKDLKALRDTVKVDTDEAISCVDDLERMLKGSSWEKSKKDLIHFIKSYWEK